MDSKVAGEDAGWRKSGSHGIGRTETLTPEKNLRNWGQTRRETEMRILSPNLPAGESWRSFFHWARWKGWVQIRRLIISQPMV